MALLAAGGLADRLARRFPRVSSRLHN
jgi:hypothetical protein